ncbi:hypothetical protein CBM2587_B10108 [Cupriavidus taiwanensis]|uniref:Uncharacterized protein n=1 Tax=Cupriavidus taiwanensis TaxID=164546 RepID=A0A975X4A5_9BURK|nr:hypothetical protein CBM2587_B10108 [Cupriavidus taiwanensis]
MKAPFLLAFILKHALRCDESEARQGRPSQRYQFTRKAPFLRDDEIHLYERLVIALRNAHVFSDSIGADEAGVSQSWLAWWSDSR